MIGKIFEKKMRLAVAFFSVFILGAQESYALRLNEDCTKRLGWVGHAFEHLEDVFRPRRSPAPHAADAQVMPLAFILPGDKYAVTPLVPAYKNHMSNHRVEPQEKLDVHRIRFQDGKMYQGNSTIPFDTRTRFSPTGAGIYVMDAQGNFYIRLSYGNSHPDLINGVPVAAAGEIVVHNGELVFLNNHSGHYQPSEFYLLQAVQELEAHGVHTNGRWKATNGKTTSLRDLPWTMEARYIYLEL